MKYLFIVSTIVVYSCGHGGNSTEKRVNDARYREAHAEGVRIMKEFNKKADSGEVTIEMVDSLALLLESNSKKIDSLDKLR